MLSQKILDIVGGSVEVGVQGVRIKNEGKVRTDIIDKLVWEAVWGDATKGEARWLLWELGQIVGVRPASIHDYYMAKGRGEVKEVFTVPAINVRGMAYDTARAIFSSAVRLDVGALILELARSEMGYTGQQPEEYVAVIQGAALREGWTGPLFIQGDHFQTKEAGPGVPKEGEVEAVGKLIRDAVKAGFYNIDVDTSTLVDLERETEAEQQAANVKYSLELAKVVRESEPRGVTVSLGGEIGHIGGKNSTASEFEAYMDGFLSGLPEGMVGMSKVSVQTGTSHGGVVMPDGKLAEVSVDFSVLEDIGKIAREKYGLGGTVQHGASTLKEEYFQLFPKYETLEIHLATGFQNILLDHPAFPGELLEEMYRWLDETKSSERGEGDTDQQFHYELRKKALGEFKRKLWDLPESVRRKIRGSLSERFAFLFEKLGVLDSGKVIERYVKAPVIRKEAADFGVSGDINEVEGLSD